MSEKITITTKDGITKGIEEWVRDKDKKKKYKEFSKLQKKEVVEQRKCLKRRVGKNGIFPEYKEEHSEVRFLTNEEIIKEYKMPLKEGTVSERGDTIRELIKFLQELEGRKVSTEVIVQGLRRPVKSVSSFLSQLFNAGIVARVPMKDHKRKFVWGIAIPYKNGELEAIISLFNDFTAQRRRNAYLKKKEKVGIKETANVEIKFVEGEEEIDLPYLSKEEIKAMDQRNKLKEENKILKKEFKNQTLSSNTLRVIVEGNIKILFGLAK